MQEWYLLKSPHDQVSGFESEALNDFGAEGFDEVLDSDYAQTVYLCNYDFSVRTAIKAVVQNTVQDTRLKSLNRMMLVRIGTAKAGQYIEYNNQVWIINNVVDDNAVYEKLIMSLCNWQLTWVNAQGKVVQRWAFIQSASQYNNGETGERFYTVRSDQLLIAIADDDESILIPDGKRFVIDRRCLVYDKRISEDVDKDLSFPLVTYKVTRQDSVLYNYNGSGFMELMVSQSEQHAKDGFYRIDGKGYWLCEEPWYKEKSEITPSANIICEYGDDYTVYFGLSGTEFKAKFIDSDGNEVSSDSNWEVICDFIDSLYIDIDGDTIKIKPKTRAIINKSFELFLTSDGFEPKKIKVDIKAF